jgi:hypothetical protein
MKVIAKDRSDRIFGVRYSGVLEVPDFSFVDVGGNYVVYGLMSHAGGLDYLICAGERGPYWLPSEIFNVADARLPKWQICLPKSSSSYSELYAQLGIIAILGYERFVRDFSHYCGVLEREEVDLGIFFVEKAEMDAQYQSDYL